MASLLYKIGPAVLNPEPSPDLAELQAEFDARVAATGPHRGIRLCPCCLEESPDCAELCRYCLVPLT